MSVQNQAPRSIEVANGEDEQWVIDSILNATPPPSSTTTATATANVKIHRVPRTIRETEDYEKYYVPKIVSIGPYHFGNPKLELVEKLKPVFTNKLLSDKKVTLISNYKEEILRSLYKRLGEPKMVQELRDFYEQNSTTAYCDKVFTKMMLLDCCFIWYYTKFIFGREYETCPELKSHQIVFVHQDLFLLENQIPFKVIQVVKELLNIDCISTNIAFIYGNILASGKPKRNWLESILCIGSDQCCRKESKKVLMDSVNTEPDHILHLLHRTLTKKLKDTSKGSSSRNAHTRCTFRNVNELVDVGIHFKPSDTKSLAHIEFFKRWWWFSATVKLPPINVDDSTKPMFLNLIAYEMSSRDTHDAGVTSYICLLDSLIDHPEDVKALRKAGVLENYLGSDKEVSKLFNEIGTDLVPNNLAYMEAKNMIQKHYESWSNTLYSQLKHEYVKSPWAFLALLGALIALFLTGVQAYFTVWSPKGECDDFCKFLKINHH